MKREGRFNSDPLLAQKLNLERVAPDQLDHYLSEGWRVLGQSLYNSVFLRADDGEFYTVLSARLPLEGFHFTKGQRKLLTRNRSEFQISIQPAKKTEEKDRINRLYGEKFPKKYCESLDYFLLNEKGLRPIETWEIEIYKGNELVGFSFFDRGRQTLYSKVGIYNPAYSAYSLGYYSMLEELAFAQQKGMAWYYPGYVVPGCADFDYKHRLGPLEVKDWHSSEWLPFAGLEQKPLLLDEILAALTHIKNELHSKGVATTLVWNPNFNYPLWWYNSSDYLYLPLVLGFLDHEGGIRTDIYLIADPIKRTYQILNCYPLDTSKQLAFFPKGKASMMLFLPHVLRRSGHWNWDRSGDLAARLRK